MAKIADDAEVEIRRRDFEVDKYLSELAAILKKGGIGSASQMLALTDTVITAQRQAGQKALQAAEKAEARAQRLYEYVFLDEWNTLDNAVREALLNPDPEAIKPLHFNKQDNSSIEWAMWSCNPITGCEHDCPYCYAREIATFGKFAKAYPAGFKPTLWPRRLLAARAMSLPKEAMSDTRYKNVFLGSMADMFGRWLPAEWIEAVLKMIREAPGWNFLCLTKFPKRMAEFEIPSNAWMGTTVDVQVRVKAAEDAFARVTSNVR
jgi:hypothetical protein